jgi:hypothetical protein
MSTATIVPTPVAASDVEDEMFDLNLRIVPSASEPLGSGGGSPVRGFTETDNCVVTDRCPTSVMECR